AGVEMDILPSGELDFETDFLQEMDLVIAAIHSSFTQSEEEIMMRMEAACKNPYVDIIAHPTGRIIGRRDPYALNMHELLRLAKVTSSALEIHSSPQRFDLSNECARVAEDSGVSIAITTDAHRTDTFTYMDYGVSVAKKAWLQPKTVMNTWNKTALLKLS